MRERKRQREGKRDRDRQTDRGRAYLVTLQIQNTQKIKRTLFNWTKRANFLGNPLFQATYNIKTEKQTINSTCASWIWEAGGRKRARD